MSLGGVGLVRQAVFGSLDLRKARVLGFVAHGMALYERGWIWCGVGSKVVVFER